MSRSDKIGLAFMVLAIFATFTWDHKVLSNNIKAGCEATSHQ